MNDLLAISEQMQARAREIIRETRVVEIWESFGATINLVGSMRTGLILTRRDIDFHIYSEPFVLADSFAAVSAIAANPRITRIEYGNQRDTDECCVEWHAWYRDNDDQLWQLDMIHIMSDSRYVGHFEKVADRILDVMTPPQKLSILSIKHDLPEGHDVMGIEIYQAVIRDGITDYASFAEWRKEHPNPGVIDWMP